MTATPLPGHLLADLHWEQRWWALLCARSHAARFSAALDSESTHRLQACCVCSKGPHLQQTQGVSGHLRWIQALLLQPQSALLQLLQGQPCSLQQQQQHSEVQMIPGHTVGAELLQVPACQRRLQRTSLHAALAAPAQLPASDAMPCSAEAVQACSQHSAWPAPHMRCRGNVMQQRDVCLVPQASWLTKRTLKR